MKGYFIDTTIPMYWVGKKSEYKKSCITILEDIAIGKIIGYTSPEVFQEIIYRFMYIDDLAKGLQAYDKLLKTGIEILPITCDTLVHIRILAETYSQLSPRDIFYASVMIENNITTILTADKGFDNISEIKRIAPQDY